MSAVLGIAATAALFILFGVLGAHRPARGCGACDGACVSCPTRDPDGAHHGSS